MTKLNKGKVKLAIENTGAIIAVIAEKLDVTRQALYNYLKKHPELKEDLESEQERTLDAYEERLKHIALLGRSQDSSTLGAIKYYLNNKARSRGFAERQEVQHSGKVDSKYEIEVFVTNERINEETKNDDSLPKD